MRKRIKINSSPSISGGILGVATVFALSPILTPFGAIAVGMWTFIICQVAKESKLKKETNESLGIKEDEKCRILKNQQPNKRKIKVTTYVRDGLEWFERETTYKF